MLFWLPRGHFSAGFSTTWPQGGRLPPPLCTSLCASTINTTLPGVSWLTEQSSRQQLELAGDKWLLYQHAAPCLSMTVSMI